jgi:hypothetical protein
MKIKTKYQQTKKKKNNYMYKESVKGKTKVCSVMKKKEMCLLLSADMLYRGILLV